MTEQIIREELEWLREQIIERSTREGQKASGKTYERIEVENITPTSGQLWGPSHLPVLEDGRKAGKVPFNFEDIIREWAHHKGLTIPDPKDFDRWVRAVAWKIRREGTALHRSGEQLDIFTSAVDEFEKRLRDKLRIFYMTEINNTIRTAWMT